MKRLLITNVCIILLQLCSFIEAINNDFVTESSIISNTKLKQNPVGNIIPGRYIIEFDDGFHGSSKEFLSDVESHINKASIDVNSYIRMSITQDFVSNPSIFRGVSISLDQDYISPLSKRDDNAKSDDMRSMENAVLQKLLKENRVKSIYPVVEIPRPTVDRILPFINDDNKENNDMHKNITIRKPFKLTSPDNGPSLPFTHSMTQVNQVHSNLNLRGKGVVVGIIDSGIDYRHPSLGGGFGEGFPVRYGYDLVGNDYNPRQPSSRSVKQTPLDTCESGHGHGTHVAGIIAANDKIYNFSGVAPEVTIGAWRVFSCEGSTSNDIVIQAMLDAHEAGCNIINLSLGSPSNWAEDPTSIVANRISEQGTIVIAAAGNDGSKGAFYVSSPSSGLQTISIASIDNIYNLQPAVLSEAGNQYSYTLSSTTKSFPSGKLVSYVNSASSSDACEGSKPDKSIKGKLVLIQRGSCTFDEKAASAEKYGAKGVIIYDNLKRDSFKPEAANANIPLAAITLDAGKQLKVLLNSGNYKSGIVMDFQKTLIGQKVSSQYEVSKFSSLGPLYDMNLKPDMAAPGGYIFSTLPIPNGGYGILSGTSMATPYITGAFALFMEKHGKNFSIEYLREHFQNYAKPSTVLKNYVDNPARQGAGLIQLLDAINQPVHVSPGYISFNDTDNTGQRTLKITNPTSNSITYKLKHLKSISITPYNTTLQGFSPLSPAQYSPDQATAELSISSEEITVNPGETLEVTVGVKSIGNITKENPYPIYGGYIQFVPQDQPSIKSIQVPYVGIKGSLSQLPIFDEKFPHLVSDSDTKFFEEKIGGKSVKGIVLDSSRSSTSYVSAAYRLLTGTSHMITEVLDRNMTSVGIFSEKRFMTRNTMDKYSYEYSQYWNGTVFPKDSKNELSQKVDLKPGLYYLQWKALKLLSDPAIPESWETKTSAPILIKRSK